MNVAVAACLWLVAANVAGMVPSRTGHRRRAAVLILTVLPMAAWVFAAAGLLWGAAFLLAAGSILRWPLGLLVRRLRGVGGRGC